MQSIGIVGLPNVGKSLLFNLLTKSKQAKTENFPFCTIDPNIGIIELKDEKLKTLAKIVNTQVIKYATFEFVDIAGIVKGASLGEGLGNQFLSHIRQTDAILIVLRAFENDDIIHVHGKVDPKEDMEVILLELILADQESLNKQLNNLEKKAKSHDKEALSKYNVALKIKETLDKGNLAIEADLNDEEKLIAKQFFLLTMKKIMYVLNVSENQLKTITKQNNYEKITSYKLNFDRYDKNNLQPFIEDNKETIVIPVDLKLEEQLTEFSEEEAKEFLSALGQDKSGLDKIIEAGFKLLDLMTFYTAGEKEVKAWTIPINTKAYKAAGVIHSDFEKKFIKAEIVNYYDFINYGGWQKAKEAGKIKLEGKDYIVQPDDIILFKINN